ncbi:SLC13 family permease [Alkaliphilus serpentinus]|nr:SLC13 family permease [Alkaliphilus serpentinus]
MMEQFIVFSTIVFTLVLFINGKLRYDVVAILALLIITLTGIISPNDAFLGFSHPAVITVAAVLVVSKGLLKVGAVDVLTSWIDPTGKGMAAQIASLMLLTAVLSSFMNNIGALALVMPIAIKIANKNNHPTSVLLMPIAFSSLLGGLITVIGTPPNLIISTFRAEAGLPAFNLWDFAPVGIGLTIIGILYIALIGWKLIPQRKSKNPPKDLFKVEEYLTEVCVPSNSKMIGKTIRDMGMELPLGLNILGIVRNKVKILAPSSFEMLKAEDILIIKTDTGELKKLMEATGFIFAGVKINKGISTDLLKSQDYTLLEAVIRDDSPMVGKTAKMINLRWRYGVNLVAVSRQGARIHDRLGDVSFRAGDIILIQLQARNLQGTLAELRTLPLAERAFDFGNLINKKNILISVGIFALAVIATTLNFISVEISFVTAGIAMVLFGIISPKEIYESIDWPIIILLGSMLPLGGALETTGGAETIASLLLKVSGLLPPSMLIVFLMLVTMLLTNVINNAAAAVLMAPIAISMASGMGVSVDPLLMAVAVSSSSAFLTPIGHQSNTLIMGPGGYHFGDYWRLGLPLSLLILILGTPLILLFWPL